MITFPMVRLLTVACLLCGTRDAEGRWLVVMERVEGMSPGRFGVPCQISFERHFCPGCAGKFPDPLAEWKRREAR